MYALRNCPGRPVLLRPAAPPGAGAGSFRMAVAANLSSCMSATKA